MCWDLDHVGGLRRRRRSGPGWRTWSRRCSSPPIRASTPQHLADLAELGFDEIYLHHVGQTQDRFMEVFGERVLPELGVTPKV